MNYETTRDRMKAAADRVGGVNKLADLAGIKRRTLGNYLSGRNEPKAGALAQIALVTGVSVDFLLGLVDDPESQEPRVSEAASGEESMWDRLRSSTVAIDQLKAKYGDVPPVWSTTIQELMVRFSLPEEGAERIFQSIRASRDEKDEDEGPEQ